MKSRVLLVAASLCLAAAACGGSGSTTETTTVVAPTEPDATLTVRWSLAGSLDPNSCPQSSAYLIDISIMDPVTGDELEAFQAACETFATSITLAPGTYDARARLLDPARDARTTDVRIPTFTLNSNEELVQDVDFPADSFL